jgi:glucose/arabinose dehydrogenase
VVEQPGRIRIIHRDRILPQPFLSISAKVGSGGERGLLSVAFHPRYAENGYFYVNYTDTQGDTRIERYRVSADPDRADPASAHLVLHVTQPFGNHNGGQIAFGPDGMLYVGMGDGGSGGDPQGHGQNRETLLGALLRLDVDGGDPYAVPADNPFASTAEDGGRSGRTACATRGASRSIARPGTAVRGGRGRRTAARR